ncbi:MAG: methylamine utilization protein [Pseudomonadota bacterium]
MNQAIQLLILVMLMAPLSAWTKTLQLSVVDKNGQPLANAAVILDNRYLPATADKSAQSLVVDQVDRQFTPFLTTMRVGSRVVFPNSDNIRHHVYSFSDPKPFELKLYSDKEQPSVEFNKPGVVTLGCNIHDQMIAHLLITDGQTAMVSDQQGHVSFSLGGTVAGELSVTVWHPLQGQNLSLAKTVNIDLESDTEQQTVVLDVAPEPSEEEPKSRLEQRFNRSGNL